jgi:hypothetical protein
VGGRGVIGPSRHSVPSPSAQSALACVSAPTDRQKPLAGNVGAGVMSQRQGACDGW